MVPRKLRGAPYTAYVSPYHPTIYEVNGHFFYPDGCEVSPEALQRMLNYHKDLCKRFGWEWSEEKWRRLPNPQELARMRWD